MIPVEEYERRLLTRLLRERGDRPEEVVKRFFKSRNCYAARLIERLSQVDPETALKVAQKLGKSSNPLDQALAAWLSMRAESERGVTASTLYV